MDATPTHSIEHVANDLREGENGGVSNYPGYYREIMLKKILRFLMSTYKKTKGREEISVSIQKSDYSNKTRLKNPRNGQTMTGPA